MNDLLKIKPKNLPYLFICFFFWGVFSNAQPPSFNFRHISIEDGLSNSVVFSVAQDYRGLFWIGTRAGIDCYNGSSVTHFDLLAEKNSVSLHGKYILSDSQKNLWVGSTNGLFKYDFDKKEFLLASEKFKKEQNINVNKLYADNDGDIWMATTTSLFVFLPQRDSLIRITDVNYPATSIIQVENDNFLVSGANGIVKVSKSDFTTKPFFKKKADEHLNGSYVSSLFQDTEKRIWIPTQNNGLYIYWPESDEISRLNSVDPYISSGELIRDIEYSEDQEFLLATDGNGIIRLDKNFNVTNHYYHAEDNPQSISNNGVYELYIDQNKRLWVATYGGGVNVFDPNLLPFQRIEHITNNVNSLSNNAGRVVIEDSKKRLWFGTQKGIGIFSPENGKWHHIYNQPGKSDKIGKNTILTICQVSENEVWIGSYGGGIDRINMNNFSATPLFSKEKTNSILGSPYVYCIYKASDGDIWIGVLRGQLIRYTPSTKTVKRYPIINIKEITESWQYGMLLSSREGFYVLNKHTGEYKMFYHQADKENTIKSGDVNAILQDKSLIYLGTEGGGLNIYNPLNDQFTVYTQEDGLPSNTIQAIEKTDGGQIWLSTTNGLSVFDPVENSFTNYDTSDGLHIKEFNLGASCQTFDGKIIFGGTKGFVSFFPNQIKKITIPPAIIFSDMKIDNKSVIIAEEGSPLSKEIDLTDQLTLKYQQNSFSFSFVGINYTNPVKNRYSWKLEGFDTDYTPRSAANTATYTNIPPGDYIFKVRSTNIQNEWNAKERSIRIKIKPPFYMTSWAYMFYFIVAGSLAFSVFKVLRMRYEERHAQEKIQFFINLAHDLKTPLTLIQSPLSKVAENKNLSETDKNCLALAQRNAGKMSQLFNQLLDFQKADMNKLQLQVAQYNVLEHIQEIIGTFHPLLEKKGITCELNTKLKRLKLWYDRTKLDKVFFNLISNAIKYSNDKGSIIITVSTDRKNAIIEIEDNGIGIPQNQQSQVFKGYYRATNAINSKETGSGVGLILVRHLLNQHNGQITFTSKPGQGSIFRFTLPLKNTHYKTDDFLVLDFPTKEVNDVVEDVFIPNNSQQEDQTDNKQRITKIVVAEDSEDLRNFLISTLQPKYKVFAAENGRLALAMIEKVHPDLVISDVMMPEMDGNTLCTHLKKHIETCHIPVILLTALTDRDYKIDGFEAGADEYLEKPFDTKILLSRIDNLLRSRVVLKDKFLKFNDPTTKVDYKSKIDQEFIQKAVQIINDNITDSEFSVEELCKKLFMSRPVLYRKLKALTDQSPQDFIKIIRLKKALEYLNQSNDNINEIAYKTGFSDPKYFSTCFRKYYGMSPSQYQKKQE